MQLVRHKLLPKARLQEVRLPGVEVAYAEALHLPCGLQPVKGLANLFGLHKSVGPVQQQHVKAVHVKAAQNAVHALQNMLLREVVHALSYAAFALDDHLLPQAGLLLEHPPEGRLALAAAVDVGVVEEVHPAVQGRVDEPGQLPLGEG